ncbi:dTDP-glucose 4,6-dehydratase [Nocardiopsis sp. CC223A]|uniref:dTDP-glucose 4,6-dehydratase n=1 Tax=Nocardiopsis sp. CC223A TaxID=3044051 RepID=UPI00278BF258|nr:dTDP-glucose 4,6-dehydratase [Nocardiopsis sp. CC223A]
MKIVVIGGAGFIGSQFVRDIVLGERPGFEHADVTVYDRFTYAGSRANLGEALQRCRVVEGDVCDQASLTDVLAGSDLVVNFAAETHVDRSITDSHAFMRTNALGTQALMRACLNTSVPRIVQVSTDEVYGSIERGRWTEDQSISPNSPYAAAKASGDLIALAYARTHGLPVSITRCGNNYGPFQYPEKLVPLFITHLLEGKRVPLYGDGKNVREWVHTADHCAGIRLVALAGEPGAVYNISGSVELSNTEIVDRLLELLGATWDRVEFVADRQGHDFRYALDDSRIRSLGYTPEVDFDKGLADTVRWYRENPDWWGPRKLEPQGGE